MTFRHSIPRTFARARCFPFPALAGLFLIVPAPPSSAAPKESARLESLVKEFRLENGLTLLVVENHESPTIGAVTCFRVGAAEERPGVNGVTHILEHMLFKGTPEIGTKDWAAEKPHLDRIEELTVAMKAEKSKGGGADSSKIRGLLDERGKEIAAANELADDNALTAFYEEVGAINVNAFTSYDVTAYILALPANRLDLWMYLESERLRRPVLRQFYTEVQNILEERRMRVDSDPEGKLQEQFLSVAYDAHWYGYPIIGFPSDIESVTLTETEEWFRRYYAPNQVTLAIVGDVDAQRVHAQVAEAFGDLQAQPPPEPLETFDLPMAGARRIEVEYDAEPRLLMGWHKPNVPHPDDAALRVLSEILTGGASGRLTKSLVEEKQIAAAIDTDHEFPGSRWPNLWMVSALPRAPHEARELEDAVWAELDRVAREPVGERELQKAKNRIKGSFVRELESNFGLAVSLAVAQASFQDWKIVLDAQKKVEAVTADDIRRVARATFQRNRTIVATLVKPAVVVDPAKEEAGRKSVARMVDALGGPEKVGAVRTAIVQSDVAIRTPAGSMTAQSKSTYATPDKMTGELTVFGQTMIQGVGTSGAWRAQEGKGIDVEGDEALEMRAETERDLFLLAAPSVAERYMVQGSADEGGAPILDVRGPSGRTFQVKLASKTGLPETVSYDGSHPMTKAPAKFVERFEDYRSVDGVKRPHKITTAIDGETFAEATVTSVALNPSLAAAAFDKPGGS